MPLFTSAKLRQVVGIDRAGSFSTAARTMNISQSTLTKAVADVEQDLGFALFLRTARGVVATTEGREFLNRAERIVADFDMLIEDARAQRAATDVFLRIGVSPASQAGLLNRIMAQLLKERPEICLNLSGFAVERGVRLLKQGDLDLLFAPMEELRRESEFTIEPVGELAATLFCRKKHPILKKKAITFDDVQAFKIISPDYHSSYAERVSELLLKGNFDPLRRMHLIEDFGVVVETVSHTNLIGIVSKTYAQTRTFKRRFTELDLNAFEPIEIGAARLSRWMPNSAMKAFFSLIQRHPLGADPSHS